MNKYHSAAGYVSQRAIVYLIPLPGEPTHVLQPVDAGDPDTTQFQAFDADQQTALLTTAEIAELY